MWKRPGLALVSVAWCLGQVGCAGRRIESGAVLPPHGLALLEVSGRSPSVTLTNEGSLPLRLEVRAGQPPWPQDRLEPGVARWWNPDGPRVFCISNDHDRAAALTWVVRNADVSVTTGPAPKPAP